MFNFGFNTLKSIDMVLKNNYIVLYGTFKTKRKNTRKKQVCNCQ